MTLTKTINRLLFAVLLLLSVWSANAVAQNREPPTLLAQWYDDGRPVSSGFTIVPDQTGNGYGEIIGRIHPNMSLFYGNNDFNLPEQGDFIYDLHIYNVGSYYVGRYLPNRGDFVVSMYVDSVDNQRYAATRLHELGDSMGTAGTLLYFGLTQEGPGRPPYDYYLVPKRIDDGKPGDLNGNGFHDMILLDVRTRDMMIFFGGDTIKEEPDLRIDIGLEPPNSSAALWISTGYDINGDGFDDLLVMTWDGGFQVVKIYLGGDPMETEPVLIIPQDHYLEEQERRLMRSFLQSGSCLLPDINGDGYDDFGLFGSFYTGLTDRSFYYIYYGGEVLSDQPDLELGNTPYAGQDGGLVGGDFNGDGYGDVLLYHGEYQRSNGGDFRIHFGSPWGLSPRYDLLVKSALEYGEEHKGLDKFQVAVGKFNDDDADDIIFVNHDYTRFVVLGGNPDWAVSVSEQDTSFSQPLEIECYPNPFNDVLNVRVKTLYVQQLRVQIYDIQGRVVHSFPSAAVSGEKVWTWDYSSSGVYFVKINSQHQSQTVKVVCIK